MPVRQAGGEDVAVAQLAPVQPGRGRLARAMFSIERLRSRPSAPRARAPSRVSIRPVPVPRSTSRRNGPGPRRRAGSPPPPRLVHVSERSSSQRRGVAREIGGGLGVARAAHLPPGGRGRGRGRVVRSAGPAPSRSVARAARPPPAGRTPRRRRETARPGRPRPGASGGARRGAGSAPAPGPAPAPPALPAQQRQDAQARGLARGAQHVDELVGRKSHAHIKISYAFMSRGEASAPAANISKRIRDTTA